LAPQYVDAHINRGAAFFALGNFDAAKSCFRRAIELDPSSSNAIYHLGLCQLLTGDLISGWAHYERRDPDRYIEEWLRKTTQPRWTGREPIQGKTLLLQAEQGLGDTIQFCRYARDISQMGATVVMEVQAAVKTLVAQMADVNHTVARGEALPNFDFHCRLISVPLALGTRLETIPAEIPYLRSDPAVAARWKEKLGEKLKPRIGIVWSGNTEHLNDHNRSIPFSRFSRIISGRCQFVSLQKHVRPSDQRLMDGRNDVLCVSSELNDFTDTAALIDLMDLVISADTAVAHLAGAMGRPIWILLPNIPDFRWLLERDDSPWYPSARLFRQSARCDWDEVIDSVTAELFKRFDGT
jgi:tetratricopeptide (TPR) repeat protein